MNTINYKVKTPFYGCTEFLAYYTHKTAEEAKAEADKLNSEKPAKLWNGKPIDWNEVEYFFASEQEEM